MQKMRMKKWYWGNFCFLREDGRAFDEDGKTPYDRENRYFNKADLEPYIEEEHGWHNSEEFKRDGRPRYRDTV